MLRKRIRNIIKKYDKLYAIARCMKSINDPDYLKLVKGYFELCDYASILIDHKGEQYPDKIIYHIGYCVPSNKKTIVKDPAGIAALLRYTLFGMVFSDTLRMDPVVEWGSQSVYYDPGMDPITLNVFEYYFEPVSKIYLKELESCKNVVDMFGINRSCWNSCIVMEQAPDLFAPYCVEQEEIERMANLYKKHIHLNNKTQKYIDDQMNEILDTEPILAVHIRGTDFNLGVKNHPIAVTAEEYLEVVKQAYADGNYKRIFLATDDANALEEFKREFKDKLLYYDDAFRSDNHYGAQATFSDRSFHSYRLGLEALRDIYTLANCDSLVCGLSNMAYAARYVNIAIGRKFKDVIVLNKGINSEESAEAKEYMKMNKYTKEWNKRNRKYNP